MNRIRQRRLQAYFTSAILCVTHTFGSTHIAYATNTNTNTNTDIHSSVVIEESEDVELSKTIYFNQKKMEAIIVNTEEPKATVKPTTAPTETPKATVTPKVEKTAEPTVKPTFKPTVKPTEKPKVKKTAKPTVKPTKKPKVKKTAKPTVKPTKKPPVSEKPISDEDIQLTNSEIDLLAHIVMGEAEGESRKGKRMVIDVILNRVDSDKFPNTIKGVIYQKGQFECTWNGRLNRCAASDEVRQLIREELKSRSNSEVLYFRTDYYHDFGKPVMKVGRHYFSK